MAGVAIRRCAFVPAARMTVLAIERGVRPAKSKTAELCVRKLSAEPVVLRMTAVASLRKVQRDVIWIGRALELRRMARRAIGQNTILATNERLMASLALHRCMGANQREEILVIADLLLRREPTLHDMALSAIRPELAKVNIRMAIGAILANVAEDRIRMTLRASDTLVHAAKRVLRVVMIEFRSRADRQPTVGRVAVLTGNRQRTVRVRRRPPLRRPERVCSQ